MNENTVPSNHQKPGIATAAFYLGIGSLVVFLLSVILGWIVDSMGMVDLFFIVYIMALTAVVCGIIALRKITAEKLPGKKTAITGIILGAAGLFLPFIFQIAVFIFFIPWLGA